MIISGPRPARQSTIERRQANPIPEQMPFIIFLADRNRSL